jgi:hypothetical protein
MKKMGNIGYDYGFVTHPRNLALSVSIEFFGGFDIMVSFLFWTIYFESWKIKHV